MFDAAAQRTIQNLVRRESRSLLQYVQGAYPWTPAGGHAAGDALLGMIAEEQQAVSSLISHLFRRRLPTNVPSSYPSEFTTLNFVGLDYLLPALVRHQRQGIAELERDLEHLSDPEVRTHLLALLEMKRRHLKELEGLAAPGAARRRRIKAVADLIDTHAHLDDERFRDDLPAVLARAGAAGVSNVIAVATTAPSSATCIELARQHPTVWAAVGIHPNHAAEAAPTAWDEILAMVGRERVVAVGETGLDRHWDFTPFAVQEDYFARHLELSRRTGLPVVVHCREAEADVLQMLRNDYDRHGPIKGVMHSFAADAATAEACLAMGLYLSFAGMLTYKNAQALRDVAKTVPLDRLLVETDSPYLSPVPLRGKRNEPANVVHTAATLAAARGIEPDLLAGMTTDNARQLFGLPASR